MLDYLIDGVRIFILGLVLLAVLRDAPARWRLWVSVAALCATLIPWHLLPVVRVPLRIHREFGFVLQASLTSGTEAPESLSVPVTGAISVALALGLAGFAVIVVRQVRRFNRWRSIAQRRDDLLRLVPLRAPSECRLWVVPNSKEAGSTALSGPEIWLGDHFLNAPRLRTVVTHEVCHVTAGDPKFEQALALIRALFWWHPLAWFWVWQARRQLELACDERCAKTLGQQTYQLDLAEIVRDVNAFRGGVALMGNRSFDLARIKKLASKPMLTRRHCAGVSITVLIAVLSLVNISANAQGDSFLLCPDDVETSSVERIDNGARLFVELGDSAADRLRNATDGRVGERLAIVDSRGTVLEGVSLTIRAPLHKSVQLVLDSEPVAMRLHDYFEGNRCVYD